VELAYVESCEDKSSALKRELAIKALPRAAKLALIIMTQRLQSGRGRYDR
jgi:predicted GIY-YIG superfamily endonuclease